MPRFSVPVVRIGYSQKQIEVESNDQEAANTLALERAPSEEFSEHDSEYRLAMKDENAIWIVCHQSPFQLSAAKTKRIATPLESSPMN